VDGHSLNEVHERHFPDFRKRPHRIWQAERLVSASPMRMWGEKRGVSFHQNTVQRCNCRSRGKVRSVGKTDRSSKRHIEASCRTTFRHGSVTGKAMEYDGFRCAVLVQNAEDVI